MPIPTGDYRLLPELTTVAFSAKKLGLFTIRGSMQLTSGSFTVTNPLEHSRLNAVLAADTFTTPMRLRDEHVKHAAKLLDVATYPTIEFDSTEVVIRPDGAYAVHGLLSVHGQVQPSVLTVTSSALEAGLVGFRGTASVDRRAFGVTARRAAASARIDIQIEAVGSPVL
ncbi:MAG TPA: YceI family protein [Acidimicrobiales bacterium]|nr:YceI family protein [Acidimicrobiales bacterium]